MTYHETLRLLPNGQYDPRGCEHRDTHYQPDCNRVSEIQVRSMWLCHEHYEALCNAE